MSDSKKSCCGCLIFIVLVIVVVGLVTIVCGGRGNVDKLVSDTEQKKDALFKEGDKKLEEWGK
jgi:hypothetical protein